MWKFPRRLVLDLTRDSDSCATASINLNSKQCETWLLQRPLAVSERLLPLKTDFLYVSCERWFTSTELGWKHERLRWISRNFGTENHNSLHSEISHISEWEKHAARVSRWLKLTAEIQLKIFVYAQYSTCGQHYSKKAKQERSSQNKSRIINLTLMPAVLIYPFVCVLKTAIFVFSTAVRSAPSILLCLSSVCRPIRGRVPDSESVALTSKGIMWPQYCSHAALMQHKMQDAVRAGFRFK